MFKIGDLARLKSGGPLMTVTKVAGTKVSCVWFDNQQQTHNEDFEEILLQKINT